MSFNKDQCRVCKNAVPKIMWKKITLHGTYEGSTGEWGYYTTTLATSITLFICPHCGAAFTDWDE